MIFIQMNSILEKNNEQRHENRVIRRIFSEKLCRFLSMNFEINSIFDIFQIFDGEKMTMQKNKDFQNLIIDLFNSEKK